MTAVESWVIARLLKEGLELDGEVCIADKLSSRICERWFIWVSIYTREQGMQMPYRIHCWVIVAKNRNDNVTGAKIVRIAVTKIQVNHFIGTSTNTFWRTRTLFTTYLLDLGTAPDFLKSP